MITELAAALGQDTIALATDVNVRTVRNWVSGRTEPHRESRQRLAALQEVVTALGGDRARAWLSAPDGALGGLRPAEVLATEGLSLALRTAMAASGRADDISAPASGGRVSHRGHLDFHSLGWEAFEEVCRAVINAHPDFAEEVHGHGQPGEAQRGADIIARHRRGHLVAFQCKHIRAADAGTVRAVTAALDPEFDQAILLVAGDARTTARDEARVTPGWDVWDRADLTHQIRSLPGPVARRIIDQYFGRDVRLAILGSGGSEVFADGEELHSPLLDDGSTYHLGHDLVGRHEQLDASVDHLAGDDRGAVLVSGPTGVGKSRLLLELDRALRHGGDAPVVWVATHATLTPPLLDELSPEPLTVVVDDADTRSDLLDLLTYARRRPYPTRVVVACRDDCRPAVSSLLRRAGWSDASIHDVRLHPMDEDHARRLLDGLSIADRDADVLVGAAHGLPLMLTIGASLIRRDQVTAWAAMTSDEMAHQVAIRWTDDELQRAVPGPVAVTRRVLACVTAFAPLSVEQAGMRHKLATAAGVPPAEMDEILGQCETAGLLVRRAGSVRVSPPALGDLLLVEAAVSSPSGASFLRRLVDTIPEQNDQLVALIKNLSAASWRWGRDKESPLDAIWGQVLANFDRAGAGDRSQLIGSLAELGLWEPERFFALADRAEADPAPPQQWALGRVVADQSDVLGACVAGLRYACYREDSIDKGLERLWAIAGRERKQPMGRRSALDALTDVAGFAPGKPVAMGQHVIDKVDEWIERGGAVTADGTSALRLLQPVVAKSGTDVHARRTTFEISPFDVPHAIAHGLYDRTVSLAVKHIGSDEPVLAGDAAALLRAAVRPPDSYFGREPSKALVEGWEPARLAVLKAMASAVGRANPWLAPKLRDAVGWLARHEDNLTKMAQHVIDALPDDLDARLAYVVAGGPGAWADRRRSQDWRQQEADNATYADDVARRLVRLHRGIGGAVSHVARAVTWIEGAGGDMWGTASMVHALARLGDVDLTTLGRVCSEETALAPHVRWVIVEAFIHDHAAAVDLASSLLDVGDREVTVSIAHLWGHAPWVAGMDLTGSTAVLRRLLDDDDSVVRKYAISALGPLLDIDSATATSVFGTLSVAGDQLATEAMCEALVARGRRDGMIPSALHATMLHHLAAVPSLADHAITEWLTTFAARHLPAVADVLLARVRTALSAADFQPLPIDLEWGQLGPVEQHPEHREWLRRARDLGTSQVWEERYWAPRLFNALSDTSDIEIPDAAPSGIIDVEDSPRPHGYGPVARELLLDLAAEEESEAIFAVGHLLSEAPDDFFFDQAEWVVQLLHHASRTSPGVADRLTADLAASICSGDISGPVDEAPPRLIRALNRAQDVLATMTDPAGRRTYGRLVDLLTKDTERHREWARELADPWF